MTVFCALIKQAYVLFFYFQHNQSWKNNIHWRLKIQMCCCFVFNHNLHFTTCFLKFWSICPSQTMHLQKDKLVMREGSQPSAQRCDSVPVGDDSAEHLLHQSSVSWKHLHTNFSFWFSALLPLETEERASSDLGTQSISTTLPSVLPSTERDCSIAKPHRFVLSFSDGHTHTWKHSTWSLCTIPQGCWKLRPPFPLLILTLLPVFT